MKCDSVSKTFFAQMAAVASPRAADLKMENLRKLYMHTLLDILRVETKIAKLGLRSKVVPKSGLPESPAPSELPKPNFPRAPGWPPLRLTTVLPIRPRIPKVCFLTTTTTIEDDFVEMEYKAPDPGALDNWMDGDHLDLRETHRDQAESDDVYVEPWSCRHREQWSLFSTGRELVVQYSSIFEYTRKHQPMLRMAASGNDTESEAESVPEAESVAESVSAESVPDTGSEWDDDEHAAETLDSATAILFAGPVAETLDPATAILFAGPASAGPADATVAPTAIIDPTVVTPGIPQPVAVCVDTSPMCWADMIDDDEVLHVAMKESIVSAAEIQVRRGYEHGGIDGSPEDAMKEAESLIKEKPIDDPGLSLDGLAAGIYAPPQESTEKDSAAGAVNPPRYLEASLHQQPSSIDDVTPVDAPESRPFCLFIFESSRWDYEPPEWLYKPRYSYNFKRKDECWLKTQGHKKGVKVDKEVFLTFSKLDLDEFSDWCAYETEALGCFYVHFDANNYRLQLSIFNLTTL